jgi:putative protease
VAEVYLNTGALNVGDTVIFIGQTTGALEVAVSELRLDLLSVDGVKKGDVFSMPVPEVVRRGDKVYLKVEN